KLVDTFSAATGFLPAEEDQVGNSPFLGSKLEGVLAQHPFLTRTSTVLAAGFVTMESGTGLVHIAPGHGEEDYSLGSKSGLQILSPVDDHGRFTNEAGLPELTSQ